MEVISLKINYNEIGRINEELRAGKSVSCPECKNGMIIPRRENDTHFKCNKCDFFIHINKK